MEDYIEDLASVLAYGALGIALLVVGFFVIDALSPGRLGQELVDVERLRPVDVRDRQQDQLQPPFHSVSSAGATPEFPGCIPSRCCVLGCMDIPDMQAPCVLASLGIRSGNPRRTPGEGH